MGLRTKTLDCTIDEALSLLEADVQRLEGVVLDAGDQKLPTHCPECGERLMSDGERAWCPAIVGSQWNPCTFTC